MDSLYNIEYAHIYADKKISDEHFTSLHIAKNLATRLLQHSIPFIKVVMIDDYNPERKILDTNQYIEFLSHHGMRPNYIMLESSLVHSALQLLDNITNKKLLRDTRKYILMKGKIPCSVLTTTWYLFRLGLLNATIPIIECEPSEHSLFSTKLVNVLPEKYHSIENKVYDYMQNLGIQKNKVDSIFY